MESFIRLFDLVRLLVVEFVAAGGTEAMLADPARRKAAVQAMINWVVPVPSFTILTDSEAMEMFPEAEPGIRATRIKIGDDTTPCCCLIRGNPTLLREVVAMGNCYKQYAYLQGQVRNDDPAPSGLVVYYPGVVGTSKAVKPQLEFLQEECRKLSLPAHPGYGPSSLLVGVTIAHLQTTGMWITPSYRYVRSDGVLARGGRLNLGSGDESGLHCDYWLDGESACSDVGGLLWGLYPRTLGRSSP